jgi:CRISPR-associated protein Csm1
MTTSITGNDIIKLGLDLLREGELRIVEIVDAFQLAGIHATVLKLASLKSPFGGDRFFEPKQLSATEINYPVHERVTEFHAVKPQESDQGLTALERLGSFVATDADENISVFDLFKTAAAIQDCLLADVDREEPFLLVSADFSGIQDTVYTISSKGALKTLRARSFMLELLTEHIVYEILTKCHAERHAVIYSGGGGFSLLLPNRVGNVKSIEDYRDVLNTWALQEFSGKFFIALDATQFSSVSLDNDNAFQALRQSQSDRLDKLKRQKFLKQLDKLFTPAMPEQLTNHTECQITRRDDLTDKFMFDIGVKLGEQMSPDNKHEDGRIWVSESSYHQFRIGDKLATAQSVVRSKKTPEGTEPYFKYPSAKWSKENQSWVYYRIGDQQSKSADCWFMNDWTDGQPFLYANYVRKHGDLSVYAQRQETETLQKDRRIAKPDHTATFQGLAASSCGADLIGALHMDVDDMGNLFSSIGALAELSTKSRMLNLFFKVYLSQICKSNLGNGIEGTDIVGKNYTRKGRNVSVIYAGGDDLFILGAWDETAELAFDIHKCFYQFTGGIFDTLKNTNIGGLGISGGLTLHHPKFPLYQMARKSGDAESVAKYESGQKIKEGLKNRIALFYADHLNDVERKGKMESVNKNDDRIMLSIDWVQFNFVKKIVEFFACYGEIDNRSLVMKKLPNSVAFNLLDITYEWHEKGQLYMPHFLWLLKKHANDFDKNPNGLQFIKQHFILTKFNILHLPLIWIELLKRGR